MTTQPITDQAKAEAFVEKVLDDTSGLTVTVLAAIGDRLGLFKDLATNGPATSAQLAARAGINERYAREWLGGMTSAGYLEYDPASGRFTLPPEHVPVLAEEGGEFFGGRGGELPVEFCDLCRPFHGMEHQAGQHRWPQRSEAVLERGDHAEVAASSPYAPEEVRVLALARPQVPAGRGNHIDRQKVVAGKPVPARKPTEAAA